MTTLNNFYVVDTYMYANNNKRELFLRFRSNSGHENASQNDSVLALSVLMNCYALQRIVLNLIYSRHMDKRKLNLERENI
jgi:hypothetical protein